jgi:hypothetical protein
MPLSHGRLSGPRRLQRILQCGAGKEREVLGSAAVARSGITTLGRAGTTRRGTVPATQLTFQTGSEERKLGTHFDTCLGRRHSCSLQLTGDSSAAPPARILLPHPPSCQHLPASQTHPAELRHVLAHTDHSPCLCHLSKSGQDGTDPTACHAVTVRLQPRT